MRSNYSNSSYDEPQALKGTAVYRLPFGRGNRFLNDNTAADEVVGGWQLSATTTVAHGQPFTVFADGDTYQLASGSMQFPNWNPGVSTKPAHRGVNEWYNPAAFTKPANGTLGNVRRNSLYGPGFLGVNLSLGKTFTLWENVKLQVRADAANAINHTSPGAPEHPNSGYNGTILASSNGVGTPYAGPTPQIQHDAISGRTVQIAAHITF
jgi:hypothetical protein